MRFKRVKDILRSNISFSILVLGAGSNFIITLVIKKLFEQEDFNTYSLFLTFIGIVSSFGLIGFDQIFLRLSKVDLKQVSINADILLFLVLALFAVPILLSLYFNSKSTDIKMYQLIITGIGINVIILTYNFFRLTKQFSTSQIFKNGFRISVLFFVVSLLLILNVEISIYKVIDIIVFSVSLFAFCGLWHLIKNLNIDIYRTDNLLNFFLSYCLNLAILTALSFGERLIILENISENDFGKYFYYATIFLFPLTLIQQYVGFKELVSFKLFVSKSNVNRKIQKMTVLGLLLAVIIVVIAILDKGLFLQVDFVNDYMLILVLIVLGLVKLVYGLFSAILGAVGNSKEIYLVNIFTIIVMLFCFSYLFLINLTLISITLSLILIFLFRSLYIYYYYVIKQK